MPESNHKSVKKRAKSEAKARKAEARAGTDGSGGLPGGVGIAVERREGRSALVVSGLEDEQLRRIVPGLTREVLIAVTAERSALRAGMMRFVNDGIVPAIVKIVAGLIVGYLLIRFGLR